MGGQRQFASFSDPAGKTVVRQVSYGLHLDKYDSMVQWWNARSAAIRAHPGLKHVEISVCGQGRLNAAYEFTDLESFEKFMGSDDYKKVKDELLKTDFFNPEVTPSEFVGFKQPNL